MGKIVLDSKNKEDLNLILHLAERLGVYVDSKTDSLPQKASGKKLADILEKIANKGGVKSITDAAKWERKMRAGRVS